MRGSQCQHLTLSNNLLYVHGHPGSRHGGTEFPKDGYLLQCQFYFEKLVDPKTSFDCEWLRFLLFWLIDQARQWDKDLVTQGHQSLWNTTKFAELLRWVFQQARHEPTWRGGHQQHAPAWDRRGSLPCQDHATSPVFSWFLVSNTYFFDKQTNKRLQIMGLKLIWNKYITWDEAIRYHDQPTGHY